MSGCVSRVKYLSAVTCVALSLAGGAANALDVTGYGTLGLGTVSGVDAGLGIKFGADIGKDMWGVKNLALTGFLARTEGKSSTSVYGSYHYDEKQTDIAIGFGATYSYSLPATQWSFQGRAFPFINQEKYTLESNYGYHASTSATSINLGIGGSAQYHLNNKLALRGDLDVLGGYSRLLSVGVQYAF